jgi:tetratricopeptide (TPR) repeat protein
MSSEAVTGEKMLCCANCGISAVDDVELKMCNDGCDLVKYCSDACQEDHKDNHGEECKKRKAELRDDELFEQPDESHFGECPLCCLPLPLDPKKSTFMGCCSKLICNGCDYANQKREFEAGLEQRCAFCREPMPKTDKECYKLTLNRVKENNDPAAMCHMGKKHYHEGDYESALQYLTRAAELGHADAHNQLGYMYHEGDGVEKDMKKAIYHAEEAAIGGHIDARHNLGIQEWDNGNMERAKKHFIIAANLGDGGSLEWLKDLYVDGHASKEDYANALRAYQAAVEATKSSDREEAESESL